MFLIIIKAIGETVSIEVLEYKTKGDSKMVKKLFL